jgi:hypothetical protein
MIVYLRIDYICRIIAKEKVTTIDRPLKKIVNKKNQIYDTSRI